MPETLKEAYPTPEALERFKKNFESKYQANKDGCWIWKARRDADDYGQVAVGTGQGRIQRAHRVAYELYTGETIPEGMDIDHLCHIRRCVRPDHLEVVTHTENMQRLRGKVEDWDEDSFKEEKTTPERVLEKALALIEKNDVRRPSKGGGDGGGYHVQTADGAPWRDLMPIAGNMARDPNALVYLFLECVRYGVKEEIACEQILGISQISLKPWKLNGFFREDLQEAKDDGRRYRTSVLESIHFDEMERKIHNAEFKDIAQSLKRLRESDPDMRKATAEAAAAVAGPNIAIIIQGGDTVRVLQQVASIGDEFVEGESREIE